MEKLEHFSIFLFEFNRGVKVAEATSHTCAVYGDNAIGKSKERKWFSRFKEDSLDTPCLRRPPGFDGDRLNALIHNDLLQCNRELANVMSCDHSSIVRHLYSVSKVKKSGVRIPHALNQNHKNQRMAIVHLCLLVID